jgi:hypothetical protein
MATFFWDRKGPLLFNFLPWGDTINSVAYCEMLKKLHRAIQNKWRWMLIQGVCILHDNACPHSPRTIQELLQSFKWEVLAHLPHSPDLKPNDSHLFSKLKESLARQTFGHDEVQDVLTRLREQAWNF